MSDLAEFLLARIREDEDAARFNASVDDASLSPCPFHVVGGDCWTPARLLAECESKRRIVALHRGQEVLGAYGSRVVVWNGSVWTPTPVDGEHTLRLLALPYADHPDFREEWRP